MNLLSKEYRAILGASAFALLSIGGSCAFLWNARQTSGLDELKRLSKEYSELVKAEPVPTPESVSHLRKQHQEAEDSRNKLLEALEALTIPLEPVKASALPPGLPPNPLAPSKTIKPEDFQTALLSKQENFLAKAAKNKIAIPILPSLKDQAPEFSMDFDSFVKVPPPEHKAPVMYRQLTAADRLLNTLLDSKPLSLIRFKRERTEEQKEANPDGGAKKNTSPPPSKPVLSALAFDLKFTANPDSLRDFLNSLSRDDKAFFVVRRIKVLTQSKDSKEGVSMAAPFRSTSLEVAEPATPGAPQAPALGEYILGEEHVEVEMRVELLSVLKEGVAGTDKKDGGKQP